MYHFANLTAPFDAFSKPWLDAVNQTVEAMHSSQQSQNTSLDQLFYDVDALTESEQLLLINEVNREGSILVVWPRGAHGEDGVRKYQNVAEFCAAPGQKLRRFSIAGVGSSDLGAAAFARTLADTYGEPVGAIVAGYGVSDLLSEALGGWLVLGQANRVLQLYELATIGSQSTELRGPYAMGARVMGEFEPRDDSLAILNLLLEEDREIVSLTGHSKGCLSIAYALEALMRKGESGAIERARDIHVTMVGTVVALPAGMRRVDQMIGQLDWFGGLNSRMGIEHSTVPGAWHHLNTTLPFHLDLGRELARL